MSDVSGPAKHPKDAAGAERLPEDAGAALPGAPAVPATDMLPANATPPLPAAQMKPPNATPPASAQSSPPDSGALPPPNPSVSDAGSSVAAAATPAKPDFAYQACMLPTGLERLAISGQDPQSSECVRITLVQGLSSDATTIPTSLRAIKVTDGWRIESASYADQREGCVAAVPPQAAPQDSIVLGAGTLTISTGSSPSERTLDADLALDVTGAKGRRSIALRIRALRVSWNPGDCP
jgi:hypothetical protein